MAGKRIISFLLWILTVRLLVSLFSTNVADAYSSQRRAYLRGGLIFEKLHKEPILVNPTQVTLYRHFNLTLLLQTNELLNHYTQSYLEFCNTLKDLGSSEVKPTSAPEYFVLPHTLRLQDASAACIKRQGKLPEVKSFKEKLAIRNFAIDNKLRELPAGIIFDPTDNIFYFASTREVVPFSTSLFADFAYSNKTRYDFITLQHRDIYNIATTHNFVYDFSLKADGTIKLYGDNTRYATFKIVCQKVDNTQQVQLENNILMKMTAHVCIRDYDMLNGTTRLLGNEIKAFTTDGSNSRKTRDISNQYQACFSDSCRTLVYYLQSIDIHSHILVHKNISIPHLQLYTIYKYSQHINYTTATTFVQYFDMLESPHFAYKITPPIPEADLFFLKSVQIRAEHYGLQFFTFVISFFENPNNKKIISNYDLYLTNKITFPLIFQSQTKRTKRYALALGGGLMLANSISSASTGEAPLSWFGNVMSSALGLATRSDFNKVMDYLKDHATALTDLSINQEQLTECYLQVRKNLANMQTTTAHLEYGTANLAIELDNKIAIKNLQFMTQLTLLKIANTISFAINHKVSPYALTQDELEQVATRHARNKIHISTNMDDVYVTLLRNGSDLYITFHIPVLDDRNMFSFYEAREIPLFKFDKSYKTKTDLKYFAITSHTNEYASITESEYFICLTSKGCQISDVSHPINDQAHCTVRTFQNNKVNCPVEPTENEVKPYFVFYDNKTFFSVPAEVSVRITCQSNIHSPITDSTTQIISGVGSIEIKPSCTIILPDNNRYFSNPILEAESLDTSNMMSILKSSLPSKYNFSFQVPTPKPIELLPHFNLKPVNTSVIQQIFNEITHPAKALSIAAIFFIILLTFVLITICLCIFSPCFRTWFRTCTFFKNPRTWWTNYKHYDVRHFHKIAPSESLKNKIRNIKLPFIARKSENPPPTNHQSHKDEQPLNVSFHARHEELRHIYNRENELYPKIIINQPEMFKGPETFPKI